MNDLKPCPICGSDGEAVEANRPAVEGMIALLQDATEDHARASERVNEIVALRAALWECAQLSGADLSGYDGPSSVTDLPALAVEGVRELRQDYDEGRSA